MGSLPSWPPPPPPATGRRPSRSASPSISRCSRQRTTTPLRTPGPPAAVHAALALVAAGAARGATRDQLLAFLGAPSTAALARRVSQRVLGDGRGYRTLGGPHVLFGGGVWVDDSRGGLTDAFRGIAAESYNSQRVQTVSFTDEPMEAVKTINESVKKATNSLIDGIICESDVVGVATDIVLANLHEGVRNDIDRVLDGFKVLKLPYMPWRLVMCEEVQEFRSYEARYSMLVFLPDARDGITAMLDVVTAAPASLQGILDQMTERTVRVKLPKFEISFKWDDLEVDLRRLGLSLPFSTEEADLRGMCVADDIIAEGDEQQRRPMSLRKVAHMAVVKVSEAGSEGGELNSYLRGRPELTPDFVEFVADRPFTFLIQEEWSGVFVFAGHVLDPTK
ncbi:putative serpin-Z5 [Panicum hallii]|uniref:putative serpin-Z5 n=1 Tax=Panicum hallii TaxID=206008 RepID=UPI000DF4E63F|nr:putative serpin-Z5 [Panicum hallii]